MKIIFVLIVISINCILLSACRNRTGSLSESAMGETKEPYWIERGGAVLRSICPLGESRASCMDTNLDLITQMPLDVAIKLTDKLYDDNVSINTQTNASFMSIREGFLKKLKAEGIISDVGKNLSDPERKYFSKFVSVFFRNVGLPADPGIRVRGVIVDLDADKLIEQPCSGKKYTTLTGSDTGICTVGISPIIKYGMQRGLKDYTLSGLSNVTANYLATGFFEHRWLTETRQLIKRKSTKEATYLNDGLFAVTQDILVIRSVNFNRQDTLQGEEVKGSGISKSNENSIIDPEYLFLNTEKCKKPEDVFLLTPHFIWACGVVLSHTSTIRDLPNNGRPIKIDDEHFGILAEKSLHLYEASTSKQGRLKVIDVLPVVPIDVTVDWAMQRAFAITADGQFFVIDINTNKILNSGQPKFMDEARLIRLPPLNSAKRVLVVGNFGISTIDWSTEENPTLKAFRPSRGNIKDLYITRENLVLTYEEPFTVKFDESFLARQNTVSLRDASGSDIKWINGFELK